MRNQCILVRFTNVLCIVYSASLTLPVISNIEKFKLSLDNLNREDSRGHIKVVVIVTVTSSGHILPTTRLQVILDLRTDSLLKL